MASPGAAPEAMVSARGHRYTPVLASARRARPSLMKIVVHYAEIGLKGRNRPQFEERLVRGLRLALGTAARPRIRRLEGRLAVELPDDVPFELVRERIAECFGVAYFGRVSSCEPTLPALEKALEGFVSEHRFASFGIRAKRSDKRHPFRSTEIARHLGSFVQERTGARVDLTDPELWIDVRVLAREAQILHERIPGPGGLPTGSAGRALAMISGGIDSPVAAYEIMRRGAEVSFAHFHSAPFTSAASVDKVRELVALLARHQGTTTLWVVPFGALQTELVRQAPAEPRVVLYRRFMLRIAEVLAERQRARALVTGDSLGQVSSQTLANLDTINRAAKLPVLRPLIGTDKQDIVARARRIGTLDISNEPDEDCCSYLMPVRPATSTRPEHMERIESGLDTERLVRETLERAVVERIEPQPR
jgi:thiamine biosynthesis protein ThiI